MEVFLTSLGTQEYESMASALIDMGATSKDVDSHAFARDLEKIFSTIQVTQDSLLWLWLFQNIVKSWEDFLVSMDYLYIRNKFYD